MAEYYYGNDDDSGLYDEELAEILGGAGDDVRLESIKQQMARAQALRNMSPEGRQYGRVYTAANPLEHLAAGIGKYKGTKDIEELEGRLGTLADSKKKRAELLMKGLTRKRFRPESYEDELGSYGDDLTMPSIDGGY